MDVDRMLRLISWRKFLEWKAFEELEPFAEERADFNSAHIVQALLRDGRPLREFVLPFGDSRQTLRAPIQPVAFQEMLIDAWIFGSNAAIEAKAKGRR